MKEVPRGVRWGEKEGKGVSIEGGCISQRVWWKGKHDCLRNNGASLWVRVPPPSMKKIKRKVMKDLKKRISFSKAEFSRKELLILRKSSPLTGSEGWLSAIHELNNKGGEGGITRIRNICKNTGRSRGILVLYGLSRMEWRRFADRGEIPGIRRASW